MTYFRIAPLLCCLGALPLGGASLLAAPGQAVTPAHTFTVQGKDFVLDGKPYQIISGEMHYPRVPREYWHDRLHKAKMMGLNTITTYSFWNVHEPRPGVYDFSGGNDLVEFMREAQQEGLYVILRPGPYVCAEWELGGYPSWLLKDKALQLRSTDPKYTAAVGRWFTRLAKEVEPLLLKHGGPILAVQVENEYGAFGSDLSYLEGVKGQLQAAGLGDTVLFTSNQAGDLAKGSLPELPAVVNFGSGNAASSTAKLEAYRADGPRMVGEYWAGWFDKWGEEHHVTDGAKEAAELHDLLGRGYSVSLYAVHGGTSFGWMNGADSHTGTDYHPDTTSYDYDAPLDESGTPRYKYALLQHAIAEATHTSAGPVPSGSARAVMPTAPLRRSASLWQNLPTPVIHDTPLSFEDLDQNYGYVLYRTRVPAGPAAMLRLEGMHSYAQVYLSQTLLGTLDRRLGGEHTEVNLPARAADAVLDILVENTGRVNYSHAILTERAGLTGAVTLAEKPLVGWRMYSLPMTDVSKLAFSAGACTGPCFFETAIEVDRPADTFLDTRGLHKGQLWLGTHNLGRFWNVGPQFTLYTPAPWMHPGANPIFFFDIAADETEHLQTTDHPIYGATTHEREKQ